LTSALPAIINQWCIYSTSTRTCTPSGPGPRRLSQDIIWYKAPANSSISGLVIHHGTFLRSM